MRNLLAAALLLSFSLFLAACDGDTPTGSTGTTDDSFESAGTVELDNRIDRGLDRATRAYQITIENLTPNTGDGGSQVFSPPVLATHRAHVSLFEVGSIASEELAGLAEDALNGPVVAALESTRGVHSVAQGGGVIPPGQSATYEIEAGPSARRLSAAFMLVNTNDAFSGLAGLRLPQNGATTVEVMAYDAGSEENSELVGEIPGPCCGSPGEGTATVEPIRAHEGIIGDADLDPAKWGWSGAVARITVERIR